MENKKQLSTVKVTPIDTSVMRYNPMTVQLDTMSVKDKSVNGYLAQIKSNFYVGVKSAYLIARDLFDAKHNLDNSDYGSLLEELGFSGSTQSKYLKIGGDVRLFQLMISGKLPFKWTSMYLLTQLDDQQFARVQHDLTPDTSARDIEKRAMFKPEQSTQIAETLLSFLQLEINKEEVNVSTYEKIVEKVKSALSKIPEISLNENKVHTVKDKIMAFRKKEDAFKEKLDKAKNIIAQASALGA
tara:strand:+ start:696 stop:1421 length:726 start_codon:yes stop_codon:yes gene_type:complete